MQLDRPWAKFCLKSYSNRLLIDFLDPNFKNQIESLRRNRKSQFKSKIDRIWSKMLILIENPVVFDHFWYKSTSSIKYRHLDGLLQSFN